MSKLSAASLVLALAACGGGAKASSTTPTPAAPSCADVATQLVTMMAKAIPELTPAQHAKIRPAIADQCTKDAWTVEARACFAVLTDVASAEECGKKLSQTQQESLKARLGAEIPVEMKESDGTEDDAGMRAPGGGGEGGSGKVSADPCDGGE